MFTKATELRSPTQLLGALVGSLKTARQAGGDLRIAAPSEQVQMVLQLSNIDKILRTYPDGDAAVTDW